MSHSIERGAPADVPPPGEDMLELVLREATRKDVHAAASQPGPHVLEHGQLARLLDPCGAEGGSCAAPPPEADVAFGVLADAFIVRLTLVPAVMAMLGERAWRLPRRLGRLLPEVDIEGERLARA